ncbi:MAG: site-specific integrase [Thalassobaculum sp.]
MDDLGAIPYLTKDSAGRKLRRNVPRDLRTLAGKTAWIERVDALPASKIKERAHLFGVKTDAEINALRRRLAEERQVTAKTPADTTVPQLTRTDVEQIALRYFIEADEANRQNRSYLVDPDDPDYAELLDIAATDVELAREQAAGREVRSPRTALELLVSHGLAPADFLNQSRRKFRVPDAIVKQVEFQRLCRLIERAQLELANRRVAALETGRVPAVEDTFFQSVNVAYNSPSLSASRSGKTLRDLVEAFLKRKRVEVGSSRLSQFNVPTRALLEKLGSETPVERLKREDCKDLVALFVRTPAYVGQHFKGLTLEEASVAYERENGHPANRHGEAVKHLAVLRNILDLAVREEWRSDNPAEKVDVPKPARRAKKHEAKGQKYQPFDADDLTRLFHAPMYADPTNHPLLPRRNRKAPPPHVFWAPLIALLSGARANEILQLERGDVRKEGKIAYLAITDEDEVEYDPVTFVKRLKTEHAVRDIPIHPTLIRIGFLAWAEARESGRLFPEAKQRPGGKPSDKYSQTFQRFSARCGVWVHRRKVFHSFRNSFNDALRDGGVSEELRKAINGWSDQHNMDGRYGRGHKLEMLNKAIRKVAYPGLDLSHLYQKGS